MECTQTISDVTTALIEIIGTSQVQLCKKAVDHLNTFSLKTVCVRHYITRSTSALECEMIIACMSVTLVDTTIIFLKWRDM